MSCHHIVALILRAALFYLLSNCSINANSQTILSRDKDCIKKIRPRSRGADQTIPVDFGRSDIGVNVSFDFSARMRDCALVGETYKGAVTHPGGAAELHSYMEL